MFSGVAKLNWPFDGNLKIYKEKKHKIVKIFTILKRILSDKIMKKIIFIISKICGELNKKYIRNISPSSQSGLNIYLNIESKYEVIA